MVWVWGGMEVGTWWYQVYQCPCVPLYRYPPYPRILPTHWGIRSRDTVLGGGYLGYRGNNLGAYLHYTGLIVPPPVPVLP